MKTHKILNSRVPAGGRQLTRAECKALRALGIACSESYGVMPYAPDINHGGPLYKPGKEGGQENTGQVLQTKV